MTAFNIVRCRPKADREDDFVAYNRARIDQDRYAGQRGFHVIKTGEREYYFVGEWDSMEALAAARSEMVATLDQLRDMLEDLGGDLGVTDPRSGEAVASTS